MEDAMQLLLNVKETSSFFWLRKIRSVSINTCCAKCFYGHKVSQVYNETRFREAPYSVVLDVEPSEKYLAYYLCGLSLGMKYENNTHVAFVYAPGEQVHIETSQMEVTIKNARWIDFESADYTPDPPGEYTDEQRKCRNWIFANYLKDGKLQNI